MAPGTAARNWWRRLRDLRHRAHARSASPAAIELDDVQEQVQDSQEYDNEAFAYFDSGPGFVGLYRTESHSEDRIEDEIFGQSDATVTYLDFPPAPSSPPPPPPPPPPPTTPSPSSGSTIKPNTMTVTTPSHQRTEVSPSSSPRLPSPPPFTEVQIGPKSPTMEGPENQLEEAARQNDAAARRIRPGTKAGDMASGPPLVPLADLESPFQLQEHLKALYHVQIKGVNNTTIPITRQTALILATPPTGVEKPLWLYELCRFLVMKANNLIVAFFADNPPCSKDTCPEMRASEWQYLCAVHDPPKSCCAIDYCCHTLDWAANVLTSSKYFPSRLTLGGEMGGGSGSSQQCMKHLTNIFRRVYRIFAHAWFQHRGMFWQVEGSDGLYIFFKTVCDLYQLIPEDNYTIPPEAENGGEETMETPIERTTTILPRTNVARNIDKDSGTIGEDGESGATTTVSVGATTRRHKHTPSTGSHVTAIPEGSEDEDDISATEPGSTTTAASELTEPLRGRSGLPREDTIVQGLGQLQLNDLSASSTKDGPADMQTPQALDPDVDPMVDALTEQTSSVPPSDTAIDSAESSAQKEVAAEALGVEEVPDQAANTTAKAESVTEVGVEQTGEDAEKGAKDAATSGEGVSKAEKAPGEEQA